MFSPKSSTLICPECGKTNRAGDRFCSACAARLGAEPSIAPARTAAPAARPVPAETRADSRFDAPRTVHSRPMALAAAAPGNAGFWIKFCIGGLIVMIGFIAWSLYILTGSKAPTQVPAGQAGMASAPPPSTAVPAVASPSAASAGAANPGVAATPAVAPAAASPALPSAAAALSLPPRTASAGPSIAASAAPAAVDRGAVVEPGAARAAPARPWAARQRTRPAPSEVQPADFGGWVEPSRPPAMTSSPNYQDAGPPVVTGPTPSPGEPFVRMRPAPPTAAQGAVRGSPDLGPPVAAGPGPHYDYSTPSAAGR